MKQASDIKKEFEAVGITISDWATRNGFKPRTVYAVLNGSVKGRCGVGHDIMVALGMKEAPSESILTKDMSDV